MNNFELERIKELRDQQEQLKQYIRLHNELEREIDLLYGQCKHPLKFIHSTDSDEFEGRSYTKTMCVDCGDTWECRSKYINKDDYFDSHQIEGTLGNINKLLRIRDSFAQTDTKLCERIEELIKSLL